MLLSWGYSLKGDYENGCVEARIAGSLLSLPWSPVGHFDDPTMRLFLANLWTMCGDWHEAQVDLRAAWVLDNSLVWAKELASREHAPAHLFVVLGGIGPDPVWDAKFGINPLRSQRKVNLKLRGQKNALTLTDHTQQLITTHRSPDATSWYERHLARESELHELILDSAYGGNVALNGALATAKITATTGLGMGIAVGGSALGLGVAYIGLEGNSNDVIAAGLGIVAASIKEGLSISQRGYEQSTSELSHELDPSERYRFVRYLPEYIWMGWSDAAVAYPVTLRTPLAQTRIAQPTLLNSGSAISISYLPDSREPRFNY
jgi:hypothetical protein